MAWIPPKLATALRWLAFLPILLLVSLAGPFAAFFTGAVWTVFLAAAVSMGAAVYLAARVAPSRRPWPIVLGAGLLLLSPVFFLVSDADSEWKLLALCQIVGVLSGAYLAWRRLRRIPLPVVRLAEGKVLRYKGTAPFQPTDVDRHTFFGREREARSLLSLVLAERLVVLFGKSGMGKSSLINAGLVQPLLDRGYFPMTVRLADSARGPVGGVLDGVRAAARAAQVDIQGGDESDLERFFRTAEFWSPGEDLLQPVLILDQFEELFTLHAPAPRKAFIAQLAGLVRGSGTLSRAAVVEPSEAPSLDSGPSRLRILLALREDYLADLEELARDIPGILQHRFRIGALTAEKAREAIIKPALLVDPSLETASFTYSEGALGRILAFLASRRHGDRTVQGDDVEPAQLQLVCQYVEKLVGARPASANPGVPLEVTEADLRDESQLRRVLEDFYDRTLASIASPRQRRRARNLCEWDLISAGGRRLTEAEEEIGKRRGVSTDTLRLLVDARLLRPEPRLGGVFYELSHDTLVAPILRSRTRRTARKTWGTAGAGALVIAMVALWWVGGGHQARIQAQAGLAMSLLETPLPDKNDPHVFQKLLEARLDEIEERLNDGVGNRAGYGALLYAIEEVVLRYPQYPDVLEQAARLRGDVLRDLHKQFRLKPPDAKDTLANRRILIPGDTFWMGNAGRRGDRVDRPRRQVSLPPFLIQEHEVTNAEYRRFDPSHDRLGSGALPVVNVTWYEAMAYAAWLGGSLPTEAQWEFAARGPEGRTYPWGEEEPTCDRANLGGCGAGLLSINPARENGKTASGVYDLAGNVSEWSWDMFGQYTDASERDPLGPQTGSQERLILGDSWRTKPGERRSMHQGIGYDFVGFRVVWRPNP